MPVRILVPELGESVLEATVGRWQKNEGDPVRAGDVLVSLETDKIDLEVSAEKDGVLSRIERQEGETVKIGDVLAVLEEAPAQTRKESEARSSRQELSASSAAAAVSPSADGERSRARKATPLARRMAEEHGVDLNHIPTAEPGRVRQRDVAAYLQVAGGEASESAIGSQPPAAQLSEIASAPPAPPSPDSQPATTTTPAARPAPVSRDRREERVRLTRRRLTIAQRLVEAQHTAAMLTTFNEVDMSAVIELRARWKDIFRKQHGVGLGISSFFVKAAIGALREFPPLNAEIQGKEMVLKHYFDIGVAIGAEGGLVVPVLRDADTMSFAEIERAIKEYARRGEAGELTLEDLRGGTFTLTNGGVFGSLLSTPILNPPQTGILGLHKIQDRPVAVAGQIQVRPMMYVALSYDHRLVDGREAVQFLVRVKELIEDPASLLFEV